MHISFICSGNICRSPMAAIIFTEHLRRAGVAEKVQVTSAGIGPWHVGEPADARACSTLEDRGYRVEHVAAQVGREHLDADLLLAADSGHRASLIRSGADPERVRLLGPSIPRRARTPMCRTRTTAATTDSATCWR